LPKRGPAPNYKPDNCTIAYKFCLLGATKRRPRPPAAANRQFAPAMKGLFVGAVMAHFVLDAGIWRLREAFQRGYMRKNFYFVFDR